MIINLRIRSCSKKS